MRVAARVVISGRVQGVGFRFSCRAAAWRMDVDGWMRNMPDGRVEALFEGEREAVEQMLEWCRPGPPGARVDDVRVDSVEPSGAAGFAVEPTPR